MRAHRRTHARTQHSIIVDLTNTRHVFSDSVFMQQRRRQREPEPRSVYFSGVTKDVAGENNKRRERRKKKQIISRSGHFPLPAERRKTNQLSRLRFGGEMSAL